MIYYSQLVTNRLFVIFFYWFPFSMRHHNFDTNPASSVIDCNFDSRIHCFLFSCRSCCPLSFHNHILIPCYCVHCSCPCPCPYLSFDCSYPCYSCRIADCYDCSCPWNSCRRPSYLSSTSYLSLTSYLSCSSCPSCCYSSFLSCCCCSTSFLDSAASCRSPCFHYYSSSDS